MRNTIIYYILAGVLAICSLSSCLKDKPYMDVSNTEPIIEFGQSAANAIFGINGYFGAFAFQGDTAAAPVSSYDTAIAVVLASPQVLQDTVEVNVTLDASQIPAFNAAEGDSLTQLPDSLYTLPQTTIEILPGHRVGSIPITINLAAFPASHQYGLPISLVNAVDKGNATNLIIVSGNSGKFMWVFQR